MKNFTTNRVFNLISRILTVFIIMFVLPNNTKAQCSYGGSAYCTVDASTLAFQGGSGTSGPLSAPSASFTGTGCTCFYGGEYMPLTNVKAGEAFLIYSSAAYDNQLTIFFEGDATPLAYQDDGGPWTQGGSNASITFIAPYSGDYRILNNVYSCSTNTTCIDIRVAKIWPWGGGIGGATPPCSATFTSTSTGSGTYSFLNLTAGQNYTISTCGSSFNTQLTLYNYDGTNWRPFAYNGTNGSDCNGVSTGSVTFEAPTTSGANNYIAVVNRMTNMGANNTAYTGINNYGPIFQKWDDKDQSGTSAVLKYRSNGTTTLAATSAGTICNGTSTGSFTLFLSGSCASNTLTAGRFERFNTINTALNGYGGRWTFSGAGTAQTDGSGQAYFTNGNQSSWTNAFYSNSTVTRTEGLTYYGRWYNTGTYSMVGWQDGSAGTSYANLTYALYPDAGGGLNIYESGFFRENVTAKAAGIIGLNKWIEFKIVLHNQGASYYVRNNLNGAAGTWTLVYYSTYSTAATLRPGVANYNYNNQTFYVDDLFCGGLAQYPATSGLAAGSYDYMAQDAFGNVSLTTGTISQYGVVGASLSGGSTNICHNTAPSQFTATGSGGTGSYTYLWYLDGSSTGVSTQNYTAPALSSGSGVAANHTVYCAVTSCSQTTNTSTYTVTVQPLPAYSLSVTNVSCTGGSTGAITITVTAGTTPFDYSKNGSTYTGAIDQPSPFTFSSLGVATYGILVRDVYNCVSALTNINVTEPANLPTFTETHTNVDCFGNSTGTITVTASGGTPGYTYTKDNSTYVGGNVFSSLAAATYPVRVKDNNGCIASLNNVIITQPTVLSYTSSKTDVVCNGNNDGTITLDGSGGTTPYAYSKNNGGAYSSGADPFTFTGLSPATYQVGIKDANNCPTTFTNVTISQPTTLSFTTSKVDVLCNGNSTGSITVTASGGTGTLTYSKNGGGSYQASNVFSGLAAGTYSIVVKDANLCITSAQSVTINQPASLPSFTETHTAVLCNGGSTGTITVTASGGTAGYTYSDDNGANYQASNVFSGLSQGSYQVRVKDANGCTTAQTTVSITQPTVLSYTSSKTDVVCNGNNDGTITLDGSGGTTPYTYSKNNGGSYSSGADPFTFTGLSPATYLVGILDANNCPTTFTSVTISQPTALSFTTSKVDVLCNGNSTGSITVTASGGTGTLTYSKNGGGSYQASNVFSGLVAGTYSIVVKDANLCITSAQSVTINQPASLPSFTETHTAVLCNGGSTGTITVTASGGTAGYTYSDDNGANYQASNVFSGLSQGSYQVRVKDANGCTTSQTTVNITQPTALSFTSSQTNVVCNGNNDGTITLDGSGGTTPYQYSINNGGAYSSGADPFTFTGLSPATYLVGILDANNCPTTFTSVTISQPTTLSFTTSKVDVLCNGNSTGSITVTASGGTGTLTYSKNGGGSYQASNVFSGLAAGTYSIKVKDANACVTAAQSVTINEPASLPSFTETHTAVLCNGGNTGTITVSASGGTTAYSYTDDNGANYQASNLFTGLSQGSYQVRVKDANGCTTAQTTVNITQPTALSFTSSSTNVVCNGNNDGTITLNGSGGVTPYTYSDDNGSNYLPGADPYTFTGLSPAVYQAGIKDANNCVTSFTTITITEPPVLAFTTTQVDVLCNSFNTGSITVNATGGFGTLLYSKNGGTSYQSSNVFSGLAAGVYSIVVKDANLCVTAPQSVTINEPSSSPSLTETHTPVLCYGGNTGTITVTASGGTPGYTYSDDNGTNYQASNFFGGLVQFVYLVRVKDANGCETSATPVNITQPPVLAVSVTQTNVDCNGNNNGTITLNGSGGVTPYTYSDDNGSNYLAGSDPYTFTGLIPAVYNAGIKDANNCVTTFTTVTITEPAVLGFTESHVAVTCNGGNNGSITVSATGGTTAYSYSKNNGVSYQASNVFNGLAVGNYNIVVKDANNCVTSATTVTISGPTAVTFTTANVHVLCNGDASGSITVSAGGGTPGYTYSKDGGTNYQASNVFGSLPAAVYAIKVKDASGCTSATQNVQITEPTLVTYTTSYTNVNCNGAGDGSITITGSGGVAPYTYSINNGTSFQIGANPYTYINLGPATYLAGVKDDNGCVKGFTSITIIQPTAITFTTSKVDVLCYGGNNASITVSASGGTGTLTYSKDNGTTFQSSNVFSALYAGTYQIKVKDANGCVTTAQSVTINQPVAALTVTASNGSPYSTTVTANLYSNPSGGTPGYTYNWSGPMSFGTAPAHTLQNPTRTPTVVNMTGTYKVTVTDANGCSASAQTIMNVYDGYVWIGTVSTDWNNNNNWSFQVPDYPDDCTQKAYIQAGTPFAPTVNIPGLTVGAITLVNGAVLTLNNDLTLCSNLVGSATAVVSNITGSGKFIMKSIPSVVQTITGKTKFDATLRIDNTAGVNVTAGASQIVNALELKAGVLAVSNPGFLTFISNSSNHSAIIDNFSAGMGGSLSGSVTMQRRYDAPTSPSYKTQHYMGSPADQPLYTAFGANGVEGRVVNPTCDEKKSASGSPYGNMAKFDEDWPDAAVCNLQGWYIVKTGNTENGRGYSVSRTGAGLLSITGAPNQATSYTRTSLTNSGWSNITIQGHRDTSGWHILSNPWLANLELSVSGGAGMDNQIAVWQTTGPYAGGYRYYQKGFEPVDIAPFQAFLVHKTAVGGTTTFTINGADRVRTPSSVHFMSMNNDQELAVNVDNVNGLRDRTVVAFNTQATDNFDPVYDGNKLWGDPDRVSLYSENNDMPMARNTLTSISNTSVVPMGFDAGLPGSFTMSFEGINSFDATSYIMLEDKKTNVWHDVRNGNYVFSGDTTDNLARFVLHFTPAAVINHTDATCNTAGVIHVEQPGTANWNYVVANNSGTQISTGSLNNSNPVMVNAAPGVYTLTLVDNHNYTVVKQIQISGANAVQSSFVASATAVEQDDEVTFTSTSTNATGNIWNFGDNNTANGVSVMHSYTAPGVYSATLTSDNADCNGMSSQQITVTAKATTGISSLTDKSAITIWSNDNTVYVDFAKQPKVEAQIEIYNVLGQQLSNEKFGRSSVYHKQFNNLEAAYVIVHVNNNGDISTKKVFIGEK